MVNPFGKIIQNGVEYDVTPYQHKIVINTNTNETYGAALNRLYNALRAAVSDFNTITRAELHIKVAAADGFDRISYLTHIDDSNAQTSVFSFLGSRNIGESHGTAVFFHLAKLGPSSKYGELSASTAVAYTDLTSTAFRRATQIILYYT